ncbi:MAG: hypothetical protein LBH72_04325, partial [Proteiniphilum sp.]|nr:hypothetical protein [Proteiniphilum sp.]
FSFSLVGAGAPAPCRSGVPRAGCFWCIGYINHVNHVNQKNHSSDNFAAPAFPELVISTSSHCHSPLLIYNTPPTPSQEGSLRYRALEADFSTPLTLRSK